MEQAALTATHSAVHALNRAQAMSTAARASAAQLPSSGAREGGIPRAWQPAGCMRRQRCMLLRTHPFKPRFSKGFTRMHCPLIVQSTCTLNQPTSTQCCPCSVVVCPPQQFHALLVAPPHQAHAKLMHAQGGPWVLQPAGRRGRQGRTRPPGRACSTHGRRRSPRRRGGLVFNRYGGP